MHAVPQINNPHSEETSEIIVNNYMNMYMD